MGKQNKDENDSARPAAEGESTSKAFWGKLAAALFLFYIGGWYVVWGDTYLPHAYITDDFAFGHGAAIKVNYRLYGLAFGPRFFSASVVSWALLFGGWSLLSTSWSNKKDGGTPS